MPTTIEELVALVRALRDRVAALEKANAELRARLGKSSSNSHKPPSTDSPSKPKPGVKRGLRTVGGQPGHKGTTRAWLPPAKVNEHKVVRASECTCGAPLLGVPAAKEGAWSRQVVEVPAVQPHVTGFRFEYVPSAWCGRLFAPVVPAAAASCTVPNLTALAATLVGEYHLSRDAAASLFGSVLNMPICAATVESRCEQVSTGLQKATAEVDASLPSAAVVPMDGTSWKVVKSLR